MTEYYNAPYLEESEHAALDHTGIPGVGGGAPVDLSNYHGDPISLTSDGTDVTAINAAGAGLYVGDTATGIDAVDGNAFVQTLGAGKKIQLTATGVGSSIELETTKIGFFSTAAVTKPTVPASPTVQEVVDALVTLGLISQTP